MAESNLQELKLERERFKRKPLRIEVYEFLKESITRGGLKPGQKLNEIDLGNHPHHRVRGQIAAGKFPCRCPPHLLR